jgi:hypothetical protein
VLINRARSCAGSNATLSANQLIPFVDSRRRSGYPYRLADGEFNDEFAPPSIHDQSRLASGPAGAIHLHPLLMRKVVFGAVAAVVALTSSLLLGELVLRLAGRPAPEVIGWKADGGPGGRGRPEEKNEFGSRGHHFDASAGIRIVLLGDSQVEAAGTQFEDMPEVQLRTVVAKGSGEQVSVASIASLGWGQDQELLALQTYIDAIHPTEVVLWFTEGNDLWNNTFPTHLPKDGFPKPTFWLEGAALEGPHLPWLASYRPPGLRLVQAIHRVQGAAKYPTDSEWESRLPPPYRAKAAPP